MSRITRAKAANGIDGSQWYPALDAEGRYVLGEGNISEDAKRAESRRLINTEAEAIEKLRTRRYWIRMTAEGQEKNLIRPRSILIDGQPI